eukprot:COSAG02_NODE_1032_length_15073_cov_6.097970_1_plen_64_part_10
MRLCFCLSYRAALTPRCFVFVFMGAVIMTGTNSMRPTPIPQQLFEYNCSIKYIYLAIVDPVPFV